MLKCSSTIHDIIMHVAKLANLIFTFSFLRKLIVFTNKMAIGILPLGPRPNYPKLG